MTLISLVFGTDRNYCGQLSVIGEDERVLCGPFLVAGRSSSLLSTRRGNPSRDRLLPYGDTPTGDYRVSRLRASGQAADRLGQHGVIVLDPVAGDAALAEANGRFHTYLHGGPAGPHGMLRSTSGSLRLDDQAMAELIRKLPNLSRIAVRCVEAKTTPGSLAVFDDDACEDDDPPSLERQFRRSEEVVHSISRRRVLQAGAMTTGAVFSGAVSFVSLLAAAPERAFADTAYPEPVSGPDTTPEPDLKDAVGEEPTGGQTGVQTNPGANTSEARAIENAPPTPPAPQAGVLNQLQNSNTTGTNELFDGGPGGTSNANPGVITQAPAISSGTATEQEIRPDQQVILDADLDYKKYDAAARESAVAQQKAAAAAAQLQSQYLSTPDSDPNKQAKHAAAAAAQADADRLENLRRQNEALKKIEQEKVLKGAPILLPKKKI